MTTSLQSKLQNIQPYAIEGTEMDIIKALPQRHPAFFQQCYTTNEAPVKHVSLQCRSKTEVQGHCYENITAKQSAKYTPTAIEVAEMDISKLLSYDGRGIGNTSINALSQLQPAYSMAMQQ